MLDTNVRVYTADRDSPYHVACHRLVLESRERVSPWYVTWGMCYELLRVVTHRRMFRRPLAAGEAWSFVDRRAAQKVLDEVRRVVQGVVVAGSLSEGQRDGAGCRLWEAGRLLEQRDGLPSELGVSEKLRSTFGGRIAPAGEGTGLNGHCTALLL